VLLQLSWKIIGVVPNPTPELLGATSMLFLDQATGDLSSRTDHTAARHKHIPELTPVIATTSS
jgi:hypothetical protein